MTLDSGQVFHWEKIGNGFVGGDCGLRRLRRAGRRCFESNDGGRSSCEPGSRKLAAPVRNWSQHYFALDHPLAAICASFPNDPAMSAARRFLSRTADHSTAEMGMPRHVHLFFDETSRAHPANFESVARTIRCPAQDRSSRGLYVSFRAAPLSKVLRANCGNAHWVTARRIFSQPRGSSAQAKRISMHGRRFRMPICEQNSAHCQVWGQRSLIVSCYLLTNVCALSRSMSGSRAF